MFHSYYHAQDMFGKKPSEELKMEIKELCLEYDIKFSFKKMKEKYGWSFKINKEFSFGGLCSLVDRRCYQDFEMTSEYAHGNSLFQKVRPLFLVMLLYA